MTQFLRKELAQYPMDTVVAFILIVAQVIAVVVTVVKQLTALVVALTTLVTSLATLICACIRIKTVIKKFKAKK
jgi:hypothetical protein